MLIDILQGGLHREQDRASMASSKVGVSAFDVRILAFEITEVCLILFISSL